MECDSARSLVGSDVAWDANNTKTDFCVLHIL